MIAKLRTTSQNKDQTQPLTPTTHTQWEQQQWINNNMITALERAWTDATVVGLNTFY